MTKPRLNTVVLFAYAIAVCFVVIRNFFSPWGDMFNNGGCYSHYNNYLIFRQSFGHLIKELNLYISYPTEYFDLYKYPPLFALMMAPFYCMPVWLGYGVWTTINVYVPLFALSRLGALASKQGLWISLIALPEAITAALNSQSNGLVVGLLLLSFDAIQRSRTLHAVLLIGLSAFIKIFGGLFFLVFLCFPKQLNKAIKYAVLVFVLFLLLPVFFGGFDVLISHYQSWFDLLKNDFSFHVKYSVMGWIQSWFGIDVSKNKVMLLGLLLQLLPLVIKWKQRIKPEFYWPFFISLLVWMVIFNHMAESATFVIAIVSISLWFALREKLELWDWLLGIMLILFTILGPTDIYPLTLRKLMVESYQLKVFPCILFWLYMMVMSILPSSENTKLFK